MTLLVTMFTATTAWADTWPEYITDVVLAGGTETEAQSVKNSSTYSGYTWCSTSLNDGTNGDVIYIGYKKGSRANVNGGYITDFIIIDAGTGTEGHNPPYSLTFQGRTYYCCPAAGGDYFVNSNHGNLTSQAANGWNMYLYYTKANFSDKRAVDGISIYSVGDINEHKSGAINCYYKDGTLHEAEISLNKGVSKTPYVYMHINTVTKTNRPSTDPVMASGLVYNGNEQLLVSSMGTTYDNTYKMWFREIGGNQYFYEGSYLFTKATNAGTYNVEYKAGSNTFGNESATKTHQVTIAKSPNSGVTVACADVVDGNAPAPQLGGTNLSTGAVTYQYSTTQNGTYTTTVPSDFGKYWVKATIAADGNCNAFTTAAASFCILAEANDLWNIRGGANGTVDHPIVISTTEQLDLLAKKVNGTDGYTANGFSGKYFELGANITYDGTTNNYTPIGTENAQDNAFTGHFDGKGHTVSGINVDTYAQWYKGLFGRIGSTAEVKNVTLSDATITGYQYTGGIVGYNNGGTVENCHVLSTVTVLGTKASAVYHGGIVGSNGGTVRGCTSAATVSYQSTTYNMNYYGGIVGYTSGTIQNCLVYGGSVSGAFRVGAVVGYNSGTLTNNYHTLYGMGGVNGSDQDGAEIVVRIAAADGVTLSLPAATYVWNEQNLYKSGTVVTLNCTVPDGKVFDHYTVNSGDISNADSQTGEHTLTGFSQDVTITGIFADLVNVTYIAADGTAQSHAAAEIDGSKTNLPGGWYVVNSNVNLTTKLNFTGDTHLILADGKTLSIDASGDSDPNFFYVGLSCRDGSTSYELTIYGQAAGTGKVTSKHGHPGLATSYAYNAKTITINGGVVEATSSGRGICGSNVIINGGQIILAPSYANITADNITLSWRKPSDYIQASGFINPSGVGTITIADGKVFTDGTGIYDHTTTTGTLEKLTNKTLHPCLVLTDNASNADAIAAYNGKTIAVALNGRTLYKDGAWNTLCLPFNVTIAGSPLEGDPGNNSVAKTLNSGTSGLNGSTLTLNFDDATTIPAGTPFLMKWSDTAETITNPVFIGVTINKNASTEISFSGGKFVGSYSPVDFTADDRSILFLGAANQLHWPNADMTLGACRAHFELSDGNKVSEILLNFDGEDNETTGVIELKNSRIEELKSAAAEWYTLDGRRLSQKPTQKGLYIHNGRKEVLK